MKSIILTFSLGLLLFTANGQEKQGRVLYERTVQMQVAMHGIADDMAPSLPPSRKDKLEVLFGNNQSLRRTAEEQMPEDPLADDNGMHFRIMVADANDVTHTNFATGEVVEQREFGAKNYIITDSIQKLSWKLTGETSTILNYPCHKAVAQRIGKRMNMSMNNGKMQRQEVADTANITAWFTLSIPVPAGPEYQGQLPGLILLVDINDGHTIYQATEVATQVDVSTIKPPTKGKKVTAAAFAKERDKLMKNMQHHMGRTTTISTHP